MTSTFSKNIPIVEKIYYAEAAHRCGIQVTFTSPKKELITSEDIAKDYVALYLPNHLSNKGISKYMAVVGGVISEGPKFKPSTSPTISLHDDVTFIKSCNEIYDPNEEFDPVEDIIWIDLLNKGFANPAEAVDSYISSIS